MIPAMRAHTTILALSLALPTAALAQDGPEMGQGEANITARADVRLSIESGPGTSGGKLSLIGGVIGSRLASVRRCYRQITESRPTVQGRMRLVVTLAPGGGQIDVTRDETNDRELNECTLRELRRADLAAVRPPGSAYVVLEFSNTAAEGVERTAERRAVEDAAPVTRNADGRLESVGRTAGGEVSFRVVGRSDATEAHVQAVQRVFRAMIPQLLDCRRKAARRHSPNGDIRLRVQVARNGRARGRVVRSSVEDTRGPRCVNRAVSRARFDEDARGLTEVIVTFADRTPREAAEE